MDFRSPVILGAAPVGLALAFLGWLVLSGGGGVIAPIETAESRLAAIPAVSAAGSSQADAFVAAALTPALFSTSSAQAAIRVEGLSRTPRRSAALVSINGGPSQWMTVGSTRDGATLVQVLSTRVVFETLAGRRVVGLGETAGRSADTLAGGDDQPPPGVRMPPPPASAPGG